MFHKRMINGTCSFGIFQSKYEAETELAYGGGKIVNTDNVSQTNYHPKRHLILDFQIVDLNVKTMLIKC